MSSRKNTRADNSQQMYRMSPMDDVCLFPSDPLIYSLLYEQAPLTFSATIINPVSIKCV